MKKLLAVILTFCCLITTLLASEPIEDCGPEPLPPKRAKLDHQVIASPKISPYNPFYYSVQPGVLACDYMKIIRASDAHALGHSGKGATVAIIDSYFKQGMFNASDLSFYGPLPVDKMHAHHGTSVASVVKSIAPDAQLLLIATYSNGKMDGLSFREAIRHSARDSEVSIINLSLGMNSYERDGKMWKRLKYVTSKGIAVALAFGNSYENPLNKKSILQMEELVNAPEMNGLIRLVTNVSYERGENIYNESNRPFAACAYAISAPGTDICIDQGGNYFSILCGTSYSAPILTGAFAIVKGILPDATAHEVLKIIDDSARKVMYGTEQPLSYEFGVGVIDIKAAVDLALKSKRQVKYTFDLI